MFLKSKKKIQKNYCEKVHDHVYFSKIFAKIESYFFLYFLNSRTATLKKQLFFSE